MQLLGVFISSPNLNLLLANIVRFKPLMGAIEMEDWPEVGI